MRFVAAIHLRQPRVGYRASGCFARILPHNGRRKLFDGYRMGMVRTLPQIGSERMYSLEMKRPTPD